MTADHLKEMVLAVTNIVLELTRCEVAIDLCKTILSVLQSLLDADDVKVDAVRRELLVSRLLVDLLPQVEVGIVRAFGVSSRMTQIDLLV